MLDPKLRAKLDQDISTIIEFSPQMWRGLYLRCIENGFNELQSLELIKTYILSQCPHGVSGTK